MVCAYLSGKMTGIEDFNFPAFHLAAAEWRDAGHIVISPAEQFEGKQDLPRSTYLRHDIELLCSDLVQGVAVLPGWQSSEGASLEVAVAHALAKPVWDARYPKDLRSYEESITEEAHRLVGGDRNVQYGDCYDDFTAIGKVWAGILGCDVPPAKVGLCMAGLKLVRESFRPKRDNLVDLHGYGLCVGQIRAKEKAIAGGWIK